MRWLGGLPIHDNWLHLPPAAQRPEGARGAINAHALRLPAQDCAGATHHTLPCSLIVSVSAAQVQQEQIASLQAQLAGRGPAVAPAAGFARQPAQQHQQQPSPSFAVERKQSAAAVASPPAAAAASQVVVQPQVVYIPQYIPMPSPAAASAGASGGGSPVSLSLPALHHC